MLTKKEREFLEGLIAKNGVLGKESLKRALWYNTVAPKYKVGDKVKVTDRRSYICGHRVVDFEGVVKEVLYYYGNPKGEDIGYGVNVPYMVNGTMKTGYVVGLEKNVSKRRNSKPIMNYILKEGEAEQSTEVCLF